jgi:hypothetical protein
MCFVEKRLSGGAFFCVPGRVTLGGTTGGAGQRGHDAALQNQRSAARSAEQARLRSNVEILSRRNKKDSGPASVTFIAQTLFNLCDRQAT